MIPWLLAIGFLSLLSQVVLLRELNVAFYGSELVYIVALGIWMWCTALGALAGRRGGRMSIARVRWMFVALGPLLLADVAFLRGAHRMFGGVPGADLSLPLQLLAMVLALLAVGVPLGLLFRWVASGSIALGGSLARAYAVECAGAIVGGAVATGAFAVGAQNVSLAIVGAGIGLVSAIGPSPRGATPRGRALRLVAVALAVSLGAAFVHRTSIDVRLARWRQPLLLATRDTPYGRVSVTGSHGQIVVFENGALAFESQGTSAEEFVHLAALQHPRPRTALVLGGGVEGLLPELQRHPLERIDDVELDRVGFEVARETLPPDHFGTPARAPIALYFDDPRRFLDPGKSSAVADYDLILVGMPAPSSAASNRYYTREFFASCAARLRPGGVLALRLPSAENLWTSLLVRRAASIHRALRTVFRDVVVVPGATQTFIASSARLVRDPDSLVARLQDRGIRPRLLSGAYLHYLYSNDRFFELQSRIQASRAPVNEDRQPICYEYTLLLWLARFHPPIASRLAGLLDAPASRDIVWMMMPLVFGLMMIVRRRRSAARVWIAGVAGFVGMVTESTILLSWQTRHGVLYQNIGILLTLFMGGMVVGAAVVPHPNGVTGAAARRQTARRWGRVAWVTLLVLQLAMVGLLRAGTLGHWLPSSALLLASGALVGALFAVASMPVDTAPGAGVGSLYAADLIGGCTGALAASLFLLPLVGLSPSAGLMACVAASGLLLVERGRS